MLFSRKDWGGFRNSSRAGDQRHGRDGIQIFIGRRKQSDLPALRLLVELQRVSEQLTRGTNRPIELTRWMN